MALAQVKTSLDICFYSYVLKNHDFPEIRKPFWDLRNTRKHTPGPLEKHRTFASFALCDSAVAAQTPTWMPGSTCGCAAVGGGGTPQLAVRCHGGVHDDCHGRGGGGTPWFMNGHAVKGRGSVLTTCRAADGARRGAKAMRPHSPSPRPRAITPRPRTL